MNNRKNDKTPAEETPEIKAEDQKKSAEQVSEEKTGEAAQDAKFTALAVELKAEKDKYLRLMAEYDNYRKRSAKERENIYADIRSDTVTKFLPVYDNLVRALEQSTEDEAYRKGVELIMTQFNEVLSSFGVTEIKAVGKKFDPTLHEAVLHEDDETKGEEEIVQEFKKGFKIGDKVVRFSVVKVVN